MDDTSFLGPVAPLRGLVRMTPQRAQRGYRLGCFLTGMRDAATRAAFRADPEASMAAAGLSEHERGLVRRRDYDGMLDYGVSNVAIGKASPALGTTLVERGAKGRGQSAADFIAERRARNEGQPWQF
jgi:gallate dioxygenase